MKFNYHKDHTEPTNDHAVLVFGSNLAANHAGGAAKLAAEKYGATQDVAEGLSGRSYAIPTKDELIETLPLERIQRAVNTFVGFARENDDLEFFMTRVGCVLAGYNDEDIAPMFAGAPSNIDFPEEWQEHLEPADGPITTFKGFDKNLACRGYQFELGGTYTHEGEVGACQGGFHACEYPLDVLAYYSPNESRYAVVEQTGDLSRHEEDTKVASRTIKISAEIGLPGLIKAAIEYTFQRCMPVDKESPAFSKEVRGAASATGDSGAASATGVRGAASATGYSGAASATGDSGAASATGYSGAASATGYSGAASATGDSGAASATGDSGAASATGVRGAASATGDSGAASATGYSGAASATGVRGAASATGDSGAASATGDSGAASATGPKSAAMASGRHGMAKGAEGNALFLVYRDLDWNIIHARAAIVGKDGIKADTYYSLDESGAFIVVQP